MVGRGSRCPYPDDIGGFNGLATEKIPSCLHLGSKGGRHHMEAAIKL